MSTAVALDRTRISDPALHPIADRVMAGERLTAADGIALFRTADLIGLGTLADTVNRVKHGDRVTFASNQHINPTNVCILRQTCVFCSYARLPKEDGAYRYTMDQALIISVQPSPKMAALATPPPLPCAPVAREMTHQTWMSPTSSTIAVTPGERVPCIGNSPTPKSKKMCSVPAAIAARLSQNHTGNRHDSPDHARSLLSTAPPFACATPPNALL